MMRLQTTLKKKHSITSVSFYSNLAQNAGRAFTISYVNSIETLNDIKNEFQKMAKDKYDPGKLKEIIQDTIQARGDDPLNPFHLETVIRTNIQSSYSKGRYQTQIESGSPYWEYRANLEDIKPGREFEYSPKNALDKSLEKKAKEHKTENVKEAVPVFKSNTEAEVYLKKCYPDTVFDLSGLD